MEERKEEGQLWRSCEEAKELRRFENWGLGGGRFLLRGDKEERSLGGFWGFRNRSLAGGRRMIAEGGGKGGTLD